ncbi:helix-turn-helix domain-containing protein [Paracnuella aquatica]|uniref:helix-turn-helix domain-containing protein n=1 Tax=Paracnuella aquatica TaxID=2268757 RepID=UPI000DEFE4C7|nr:helix-turn-helix domain-containing protein [Paracnuella aquatica]RPD43683.1 DNA-binding protein [Paracnuella aquatica]
MKSNPYFNENSDLFRRRPELLEFISVLRYEVQQAQRPASEIILDDPDLQKMLKVSKRTTANYRAQGHIAYSHIGGKVVYFLSDVLDAIKSNRIAPIQSRFNN